MYFFLLNHDLLYDELGSVYYSMSNGCGKASAAKYRIKDGILYEFKEMHRPKLVCMDQDDDALLLCS